MTSNNDKTEYDAQQAMLIVIMALTPCFMMGVYVFGLDMLDNMLGGCGLAVLISWLMWKFSNLGSKPGLDMQPEYLAALITGALIVFGLPSTIPIWIVFTGVAIAMIPFRFLMDKLQRMEYERKTDAGKEKSVSAGSHDQMAYLLERAMVSAAAAQTVLWLLFREEMNTWPLNDFVETRVNPGDVATGMTPLGILAEGGDLPGLSRMAVGFISGPCGEVSVAAALIGGVYLIWKKIISPVIPAVVIVTIFAAAFVYYTSAGDAALYMALYHVLAGGAVFGAFFLAPAVALKNKPALSVQIICAVGIGLITMALRIRGIFVEGMALPVLIMYAVVLITQVVTRAGGNKGKPEKKS